MRNYSETLRQKILGAATCVGKKEKARNGQCVRRVMVAVLATAMAVVILFCSYAIFMAW